MSEDRLRLIEKKLDENEKKIKELEKLFENGEINEDEYTDYLYTFQKNKESLIEMIKILKKELIGR